MINALGAEVDRLEADVAKLCPGIRHIDLVSPFAQCHTCTKPYWLPWLGRTCQEMASACMLRTSIAP